MEPAELVDAALAGFDQGETVTIPSLSDVALWEQMDRARTAPHPHLSLSASAERFGVRNPDAS